MTTKATEALYEDYEETLNEVHRVADKVTDVVAGEEIPIIIAALAMAAIDVIHQMEGDDSERIKYMTLAFTAAWNDYHGHPPTDELH